jgi:hypothetical protein
MHPQASLVTARQLAEDGLSAAAISRAIGVPRRTVADWLTGQTRSKTTDSACTRCGVVHDRLELPESYVYLLGLYLGDGCISHGPRDVFKLRIFLDLKYPEIIAEAMDAAGTIVGHQSGLLVRACNCAEVYSYWRAWPCLIPQHGPGKKHERRIALEAWQKRLVARWPDQLIKGLIQTDGCRFRNTGRDGWSAYRYAFKNYSLDIHTIFRQGCDLLGIRWSAAGRDTTYVSRKADVARLDEFIGPKR